jgi:hypothetical protein
MTTQPSIAFVSGVDTHGAKPPKGFPHRFAVLTWFEHDGSMADPWSLFREAIPRIGALVNADFIMAEYWHSHSTGIIFLRDEDILVAEVAWEGLMHSSNEDLNLQTFPSRIRFNTGGDTTLIAETERWSMVGGPAPYHDSVTVSFFSAIPMSEMIQSIFTDEAAKLAILAGEPTEAEQAAHGDAEESV